MNVLIVTAHPSSKGLSHPIAARYAKVKEARGHEVFVMDLYKKKYAQPFLTYEHSQKENKVSPAQKVIQERIMWADEVVFVFPVWWFGPPAILKNFLDQNFTSGFAYKYNPSGVRRELLEGRTARIFTTADGPLWLYAFYRAGAFLRWKYGVLGFCGIELLSLDTFAEMFKRTEPHMRERMLARVEERARAHEPITIGRQGRKKKKTV